MPDTHNRPPMTAGQWARPFYEDAMRREARNADMRARGLYVYTDEDIVTHVFRFAPPPAGTAA